MPLRLSRKQFQDLVDSRRFSDDIHFTENPIDWHPTRESIQHWIGRIRNYSTWYFTGDSDAEICRALNKTVILTHERRKSSGVQYRSMVFLPWHVLCTDTAFLRGLLQLLLTGGGFSDAQECAVILLYNLCTIASRETSTRNGVTLLRVRALTTLIDQLATPLSIVLTGLQLNRLLPWVSGSLIGLLSATAHCRCMLDPSYFDWPEQACLLTHTLMAIKNALPSIFTRTFEMNDATGRLDRFGAILRDKDLNITVVSSLFQLLDSIMVAAVNRELMKASNRSTLEMVLSCGLSNTFLGVSAYWSCKNCRSIISAWLNTGEGEPACPPSSCTRLWTDQDEEIMTASHDLVATALRLSCSFQLVQSNNQLIFASLRLAVCLVQCGSDTRPAQTTTSVLNLLRIIGTCCTTNELLVAEHMWAMNGTKVIDILLYLAVWLSFRVDWMYCAQEICWCLANVIGSMDLSVLQPGKWQSTYDLFVSRCFLTSLANDYSSQAIRLLYNSMCSGRQVKMIPNWAVILDSVERNLNNRIHIWSRRFQPCPSNEDVLYIQRLSLFTTAVRQLDEANSCNYIKSHCKYLSIFLQTKCTGYNDEIPVTDILGILLCS